MSLGAAARIGTFVLCTGLFAACTTTPPVPPGDPLFDDRLFAAPTQDVSAADLFTLTPAMKAYARANIGSPRRGPDLQQQLVDALYTKGQLRLEYDAAMTRNAAQAFEARSGNCLSLVIMTAAFAKEFNLTVHYQQVLVQDSWSRNGDTTLSIGHVNLTLARKPPQGSIDRSDVDPLQVDFLPPPATRGLRTRHLSEDTIVAMYMNNRAVELMTQGQINEAYWWARAAIQRDASYLVSYNTLAVVYQRGGHLNHAVLTLSRALEREPNNTQVLSNLARVYEESGRSSEAAVISARLAKLEPNPPFSYYYQGLAALRAGDAKAARDLFAKEVERAGYYHEFHFWLAVAYLQLGQTDPAHAHMTIAHERSTTRDDQQLYANKLRLLKSSGVQPALIRP